MKYPELVVALCALSMLIGIMSGWYWDALGNVLVAVVAFIVMLPCFVVHGIRLHDMEGLEDDTRTEED